MTREQAWKKYLYLRDELNVAELDFSKAMINGVEKESHEVQFRKLSTKVKMRNLQSEVDKIIKYLDEIGFVP